MERKLNIEVVRYAATDLDLAFKIADRERRQKEKEKRDKLYQQYVESGRDCTFEEYLKDRPYINI